MRLTHGGTVIMVHWSALLGFKPANFRIPSQLFNNLDSVLRFSYKESLRTQQHRTVITKWQLVDEIFKVEKNIVNMDLKTFKRPLQSRTKRLIKLQTSMTDYTQNCQCLLHILGTGQSFPPVPDTTRQQITLSARRSRSVSSTFVSINKRRTCNASTKRSEEHFALMSSTRLHRKPLIHFV